MQYISTRGTAPEADFATVILDGLAPDGGLYVPKTVPAFGPERIAGLPDADLGALTRTIVAAFAGDAFGEGRLDEILGACHARFTHPAVTPLVQVAQGRWVMELFHGPTLAFKDLAMQVLAPLLGHFLRARGRDAFIIGATSGDTGGAALSAFADVPEIGALFLYPDGGVSPFQEAQMQGLSDARLRAVPVRGSFDDCQRIVKALLASPEHRERLRLTAVNSVNWGRILAQSAYYALAALRLGRPGRPVHFVVPTGNFGNVYAGDLARRMGFPVGELVVATNENDSLHRVIQTGALMPGRVVRTNTPAIDIQIASNLERALFDAAGAETVRGVIADLAARGQTVLPGALRESLRRGFRSTSISRRGTLASIRETHERTGYLADPHTALALAAADRFDLPPGEVVVLSTAHPVKFAETLREALGSATPHLRGAVPPYQKAARSPAIAPDEGLVLDMIGAMDAT
jgi:threonine synthase